ncbi:hypothetical protein BD310DRAFT_422488 [Dichomitus squalens]|uniref:Uncharacterized protein n=1 Tax=Dichomitus squalens TaxID=114155 RepID=A0A4Q9P9J7_9APHY|nr:hypothetical protein BD310DRAFT_422488 [Dichomitus squalens]
MAVAHGLDRADNSIIAACCSSCPGRQDVRRRRATRRAWRHDKTWPGTLVAVCTAPLGPGRGCTCSRGQSGESPIAFVSGRSHRGRIAVLHQHGCRSDTDPSPLPPRVHRRGCRAMAATAGASCTSWCWDAETSAAVGGHIAVITQMYRSLRDEQMNHRVPTHAPKPCANMGVHHACTLARLATTRCFEDFVRNGGLRIGQETSVRPRGHRALCSLGRGGHKKLLS